MLMKEYMVLMNQSMVHKMKFATLFNWHQVDIWTFSLKTQLPPFVIQALLVDIGVTRKVAERAIRGLNELRGTHYTIEDVYFNFIQDDTINTP